jgi:hypothetical protein
LDLINGGKHSVADSITVSAETPGGDFCGCDEVTMGQVNKGAAGKDIARFGGSGFKDAGPSHCFGWGRGKLTEGRKRVRHGKVCRLSRSITSRLKYREGELSPNERQQCG